ncbi:PepSY-associated TM helix domain-containing protein [Rheinheimera sp. 4Y26]|uniref:PepSY-associated TM helix domain-containing protein n=1 Tax=Rheinheimera sp. 4Y26 TaxID=2977811 RepID=UPI0021B09C65|nr:PepSY-associated TM helix domain-containing protein [Rheinheimera sp. 4Y26]MCT6698648.1 PepSY domain-containing protein [Rheinheimera sp. 4Y26]
MLKNIHRQLGLWLGFILLLLCASGSILLFKNPLLQWQYPQLDTPLVTDLALLGRSLDQLTQQDYAFVRLPQPDRPWLELSRHDGTLEYRSADGRLLLSRAPFCDWIDWNYQFHLYLLVKPLKHQLPGVVGILSLLLLATGLASNWPRRFRAQWLRLPFAQSKLQQYRQWHFLLGLFSLPLLVWVVLTGTAMSYHSAVQQALSLVFSDQPQPSPAVPPQSAVALSQSQWQLWLPKAQQSLPQAKIRLASFRQSDTAPVSFRLQQAAEWHPNGRSVVQISAATAAVLTLQDATKAATGQRISQLIYPLHTAAVGGTFYRWLLAIAGILPLLLWLLGLGWRQRTGKNPAHHP